MVFQFPNFQFYFGGSTFKEGSDMHLALKKADERMYQEKKEKI